MPTSSELIRLAVHKAALRRKIGLHRVQYVEASRRLAQPIAWLDRCVNLWRQLSPIAQIAAMPLGLLVQRATSPRLKVVSSLLKWGPVVFSALRGLTSKPATSASSLGSVWTRR